MAYGDSDQGLWVGSIPIRKLTAEVTVGTNEITGGPVVIFSFKPDWQPLLRRETERRIGKMLQLRLDGEVLSEPIVLEPIYGACLQLDVNSDAQAERIKAAADAEV